MPLPGSEIALVVGWLVLFAALGAIALPASSLLFYRFADRGAGLSIPLALAVLGVVGYWFGRVAFGTPAALVAVLVLAGLSIAALRRGAAVDWRRYGETLSVFAAAFLFLVLVRAADPGVVAIGGEKFLDFGLLNSLSRTQTLPPEDPWFAGERARYYYGGHLLAALLGKLAGTPAHYTYNLALAGTYGTIAAAAYGLGGSIAASRGASRRRGGLFAAFLLAFASNLATPVRALAAYVPGVEWVAGLLGVPLTRGGGETVAHGLEAFGYWDASRVIPGTINEFPLFAFLNGDLHAHMLSLPFLLLAIGLLFAYWQTPAEELWRRRLLVGVALPVVAGWLAVVNTWELPTALGLAWLTLAFAPASPWSLLLPRYAGDARRRLERSRTLEESARPIVAAVMTGVAGALAVLFVLPFFTEAASANGGTLEFVADRSDPVAFLLVHGAFLGVAAWYLAPRLDVGPRTVRDETVAMAMLLVAMAWLLEAAVLALVAPVVLAGWYLLRTGRTGYETVLFVGGAGLVGLVELVYFAEQAGPGRLNTVFKTYVHVWVVWSIAAGAALSHLTGPGRRTERAIDAGTADAAVGSEPATADGGSTDAADGSNEGGDGPTLPSRRRGLVVALALVCALSLYGGLALADHFGDDASTLDARHDVRTSAPDEAAAFEWLADREGQPRIVEAPTPPQYTYGSPDTRGNWPPSTFVNGASTFSGLPTVAGWTHSADYHGDEPYWERVDHADTVFTGTEDERAEILARYDVRYVYVGPNERAWYDLADLEDDEAISVAATFGDVTIYEVDRSALPES